MTQVYTPDDIAQRTTKARNLLIGYLMTPPQESEKDVQQAIMDLARALDVGYDAAYRYLLAGNANA